MNGEKVIDLLWEVKEGKKHPNKAYKELCVLFNVSTTVNCEKWQHDLKRELKLNANCELCGEKL